MTPVSYTGCPGFEPWSSHQANARFVSSPNVLIVRSHLAVGWISCQYNTEASGGGGCRRGSREKIVNYPSPMLSAQKISNYTGDTTPVSKCRYIHIHKSIYLASPFTQAILHQYQNIDTCTSINRYISPVPLRSAKIKKKKKKTGCWCESPVNTLAAHWQHTPAGLR
jgi:hypothetical protein